MIPLAQVTSDLDDIWDQIGSEVVQSIVVLVGALVVWLISTRLGDRWLRRQQKKVAETDEVHLEERSQRLHTLWSVARTLILVAIIIVVLLTLMGIWGIPIGPFIALGGVVGIAVGFGAQEYIKDMIGGFLIVLENQFGIGDVVEVGGVSGTVAQIRLRTTVLRGLDGTVHHVPNGEIRVASNLTHEFSRLVLDIGVAYGEEVDRVIEVIGDELDRVTDDEQWSASFLEEPQILGVNELADSAVIIRVLITTKPTDRWAVKRDLLRRIKNRFDAEGIEIPFPYRTVIIRGEGQAPSPEG